jgi:hypothetical protein
VRERAKTMGGETLSGARRWLWERHERSQAIDRFQKHSEMSRDDSYFNNLVAFRNSFQNGLSPFSGSLTQAAFMS